MANEFVARNGIIGLKDSQITGSLYVSSSVVSPQFTGSLFGTASWARNALSSSYPFLVTGSTLVSNYSHSLNFTASTNDIFIGLNTGVNLYGSQNSVLIGTEAGSVEAGSLGTSYASFQNGVAIGREAGKNADTIADSVFIGYLSGYGSLYAAECVFLGVNSGFQSLGSANIAIGNEAAYNFNTGSGNNNIFLGYRAGKNAKAVNSIGVYVNQAIGIGYEALQNSDTAENTVAIGNQAGELSLNPRYSNYIGGGAGFAASGSLYNNFFGWEPGLRMFSASYTNAFGYRAGYSSSNSSYSNFIGYQVGLRGTGAGNLSNNNTIIGTNITLPNSYGNYTNLGAVLFISGTYSTTSGNPFSGSMGGGRVGINIVNPQYNLDVSGSGNFTGNLIVTGSLTTNSGITGSLFGTASWAVSASNAITASYILNAVSSSFAFTASFVALAQTASFVTTAQTASYVTGSIFTSANPALSSSYALTASFALNAGAGSIGGSGTANRISKFTAPATIGNSNIFDDGTNLQITGSNIIVSGTSTAFIVTGSVGSTGGFTGSLFGTASYVTGSIFTSANPALSSSFALTSSYTFNAVSSSFSTTSATASSADNFVVRQNLTASNALFTGTITAQTLVVQTVSSSIIYSSGSNTFGDELTDIQQFTGSVTITGSLSVTGPATINNLTGSLFGTSSWGVSASNATTASYVLQAVSASFASTASFINNLNQNLIITGSVILSSSAPVELFVIGATQFTGSVESTGGFTGSLFGTSSWAISASNAVTASYVLASSVIGLNLSQINSGSVTASVNVNSASFQITSGSTRLFFVSSSGFITAQRLFLSSSQNMATGSTLVVFGSGSAQPVFTVQGSQGELFSVNDSLSGSLFSVNDISGLPIIEAFSDNRVLIGSYQAPMLTTTVRTTLAIGNNIIYQSIPTASYDAVFFEYSLKSGSNARAGSIMSIWSGSDANYTEAVTTDFGNTTGVKLMVMVTGSNVALTGSATTANWTMKTIVRAI